MPERWESEIKKLRSVEPSEGTWQRAQMPPKGDGMPPGRERLAAGVVAFAVFLAVAGFAWIAVRNADRGTTPADTATPSVTPAPTTPTATSTPSEAPSPTRSPYPTDLTDGRYYVRIISVDDSGDPMTVEFDLAYLYTGAEARAQASASGTAPIPGRFGDVYYVNDNPKLRTLALDPGAKVTLYEEYVGDPTTTLTPIGSSVGDFVAGMRCRAQLPGVGPNPMNHDWWITVRDGWIVGIEEAMDVVGDPAADGPCTSPS
jgi:hypothetical protein